MEEIYMALNFEYYDAASNAVADGVYIPVAALPGVLAAELDDTTPEVEGKVLLALLNQMFAQVPDDALGFSLTKGIPAGSAADIINLSFSATWVKMVNLDTDVVSVIPVPGSGTNSGVGDFAIADVFPGAAKVAAAGAVAGAGIVVPTALLLPYSSLTHAGLNPAAGQDNRLWFCALVDYMAVATTVRDTDVTSAVTATSLGTVDAETIPDAYTATTNPTSGILAADLNSRGLVTRTNTYTVQLQLSQSAQTFDVRVA